jgi:hypothetical protein
MGPIRRIERGKIVVCCRGEERGQRGRGKNGGCREENKCEGYIKR